MSKAIRTLALATSLLFLGMPIVGAQTEEEQKVAATVQASIDKILTTLKDEALSPKKRREGVKDVIESMADLRTLGKLSLGSTHWKKISDTQKEAFTELFVETIRQSTYEKLELFTDEEVEVEAPQKLKTRGSPKYRVVTWILSKGQRTELALMLYKPKDQDQWRVYDLEIEGVSIRKSYGSQYNDFLLENSFDELLDTMRKKIADSKKKMAALDAKEA